MADISKENISVVDKSTVDISVADIPVEEFLDKDVSAINLSSAPSLTILIDFELFGQQIF